MDEDMFEDLLNLEDTYYQDGYRLGVEDGSRAGRIEGRTFGLEKGFEKFFEMGRLNGKSEVWDARMPFHDNDAQDNTQGQEDISEKRMSSNQASSIKMLPKNERLASHVRTLFALTEFESLSTENTEDAVSEFDDRIKRAVAKVKVIENIIRERGSNQTPSESSGINAGVALSRSQGAEKNMEDFGVQNHKGSGS